MVGGLGLVVGHLFAIVPDAAKVIGQRKGVKRKVGSAHFLGVFFDFFFPSKMTCSEKRFLKHMHSFM